MKQKCNISVLFAFGIFVIVTIFLFGGTAGAKTVSKGKVVIAIGTNLATMDPHRHSVMYNYYVNWATNDNLVYRDPKTMKIGPHLAESWRLINDTTWEFKLRKGVTFHNGNPFNAECVKFTIDRILDPKTKSALRGAIKTIDHVEIVDDYTVRIITKEPNPVLLHRFTSLGIVDPKHLKEVGDEGLAKKAMGTGPYKFVEWVKGERLVLEANENYWKFTPAVKTIVFRPIPEMATQIAELLSGGVDIIMRVPPDQASVIENSKTARISKVSGLRVVFLQLDASGWAGSTLLQNRKVRQAFNYAINVEGIMKHILGGMALRCPTGVNPMSFGYDGTIKPYPYDPEKAKKLLAEAGYPDGFTIDLSSYSGSIISVKQIVEAISGDLAKIGVKVNYRHFEDAGLFVKSQRAAKLKDTVLSSWGSWGIFDADLYYYPNLREDERFSYVRDPKVNKLLDEAKTTMDVEKRKKLYSELQEYIVENAYMVPMYAQYSLMGVSNRINYEAASDDMLRVFDIIWRE